MKKITLLFILFAVVLNSNAQTDCEPATITNVEREGNGNRITWKMPPNGEEVTISQGGEYGDKGGSIGPWTQIRSFGVYHRFTPEHLAAINGGELTQVIFVPYYAYHQQEPGHTHTIKVYKGGSWGEIGERNPGTLITSQELDNADLIFFEDNTITLTTSITIDASQELWIGYFCTDIETVLDEVKACAGLDEGPCNNGFGNVTFYENMWQTYLEVNPIRNFNWVIKGKVQTIDNVTVNIYFNGNELESDFSGTTYFHENPTGVEHCYKVAVNCLDGGVSPYSNEECIPGVGIYDNLPLCNFIVYPNPAKNLLHIVRSKSIKAQIEIYNIMGATVMSFEINDIEDKINISSLISGVYLLRLSDENGVSVQRFIKE